MIEIHATGYSMTVLIFPSQVTSYNPTMQIIIPAGISKNVNGNSIEAYIPDTLHRKREERYQKQARCRDGVNKTQKEDGMKPNGRLFPERRFNTAGKRNYALPLGMIEAVFGSIRFIKKLDRFSFRGKVKVNIQWMLCCIVYIIEKIMNYGFIG